MKKVLNYKSICFLFLTICLCCGVGLGHPNPKIPQKKALQELKEQSEAFVHKTNQL